MWQLHTLMDWMQMPHALIGIAYIKNEKEFKAQVWWDYERMKKSSYAGLVLEVQMDVNGNRVGRLCLAGEKGFRNLTLVVLPYTAVLQPSYQQCKTDRIYKCSI